MSSMRLNLKRVHVQITTDAAGDATATLANITGYLHAIAFVDTDTQTPDFTIARSTPAFTILDDDGVTDTLFFVRYVNHDSSGNAGQSPLERLLLIEETITVTVENGGDTKNSDFYFYLSDLGSV